LEAAAFGVLFLSPDEKEILNLGHNGVKKGNVSVIAAGTGLGEAFLHWDGEGFRPIPSEGGHSDFAPQGETQVALYHFLSSEFGHVSYERILSGPGIFNIYRFLRDTGQINESKWIRDKLKEGDPSATIT
jgi:glucokinase